MDLLCPRCAEPVDNDYFHDAADELDSTYSKVASDFRNRGCVALGSKCNTQTKAHPMIDALYDMLGDDMDGAAAMIEDMQYMGVDL